VALFATRIRYNVEDRETGEYHGHGFTCLLDNLQAAFPDVKLRYPPSWIEKRKALAERYREALSEIPDLLLPHYSDPGRIKREDGGPVFYRGTRVGLQGEAFSHRLI
jgi:dTDP-4-amino-4,6-dideoxygalactose transaminase